jgi:hypothetical protein
MFIDPSIHPSIHPSTVIIIIKDQEHSCSGYCMVAHAMPPNEYVLYADVPPRQSIKHHSACCRNAITAQHSTAQHTGFFLQSMSAFVDWMERPIPRWQSVLVCSTSLECPSAAIIEGQQYYI